MPNQLFFSFRHNWVNRLTDQRSVVGSMYHVCSKSENEILSFYHCRMEGELKAI